MSTKYAKERSCCCRRQKRFLPPLHLFRGFVYTLRRHSILTTFSNGSRFNSIWNYFGKKFKRFTWNFTTKDFFHSFKLNQRSELIFFTIFNQQSRSIFVCLFIIFLLSLFIILSNWPWENHWKCEWKIRNTSLNKYSIIQKKSQNPHWKI